MSLLALKVGVLALQGDYPKHIESFSRLRVSCKEIRSADDLEGVGFLVIPGGESTSMTLLMSESLRASLLALCQTRPVWGTCAGMIMLAARSDDPRVVPLGLMDIEVDRNGFGRQVHSFEAELRTAPEVPEESTPLTGVFIRAPRIVRFGNTVRPLVWLGDEPVCVRQCNLLASSFHPELTNDTRLQRYFLAMSV